LPELIERFGDPDRDVVEMVLASQDTSGTGANIPAGCLALMNR
jgi:hypothetical protein